MLTLVPSYRQVPPLFFCCILSHPLARGTATMKTDNIAELRSGRVWLTTSSCDLDEFIRLITRVTNPADYPLSSEIVSNVPVYEGNAIRKANADPEARKALMAEWAEVMLD